MDDFRGDVAGRPPQMADSRAAAPLAPDVRPDYDAPTALSSLLESMGFGMRKRYGQNFLVRSEVRKRILALAELGIGSRAWEIGPGIGAMTGLALDSGAHLTAFEIDQGFAELLRGIYGGEPRFELVVGDFLKTWKGAKASSGDPDAIFGNLPYNAAAAMLASIAEEGVAASRLVFTVQKEAALRIVAAPGAKDYSAYTVLCRSVYDAKLAFDVGRASFWPQPRVESSVVLLKPRKAPVMAEDRRGFSEFTRRCFATRRKTLRNNLRGSRWGGDAAADALRSLGLREDARAEALSPEELAGVYRALMEAGAAPRA